MGKSPMTLVARGALAGALAVAVLAVPAPAGRGGYEIFTHASVPSAGPPIGLGGDGSVVLYTTRFSITPKESIITAADLEGKPFLEVNDDLFRWEPDVDRVEQFTATANIENSVGDGIEIFTFNSRPAVESRTYQVRDDANPDPRPERVFAAAFVSNADQSIPGPSASIDAVDPRVAALGGGTIYVWDSEDETFTSVFQALLSPTPVSLDFPSLTMKTRAVMDKVKGIGDKVAVGTEIRDVLVAFSGVANPAADNLDGNSEIFLWRRRLAGGLSNQFNGGVVQVTHTLSGTNWAPAVNRRGEIAFLSTSDITGQNPDGSVELFLWRRGRFRQLTNIATGTIGTPRWSANGRVLVFDASADLTRANPDESSEIFTWDRRRLRQITEGTAGASTSPSTDSRGRRVAFVTTADTPGVVYSSASSEVVATNRRGGALRQLTFSTDGFPNESPVVTNSGGVLSVTWVSSSNLDGRNSNNRRRIYRTDLPGR